jgi:hypothetical protein
MGSGEAGDPSLYTLERLRWYQGLFLGCPSSDPSSSSTSPIKSAITGGLNIPPLDACCRRNCNGYCCGCCNLEDDEANACIEASLLASSMIAVCDLVRICGGCIAPGGNVPTSCGCCTLDNEGGGELSSSKSAAGKNPELLCCPMEGKV